MKKQEYNWWTDPKNKEEVDRISWWNHAENNDIAEIPISVKESDGVWVATFNDETRKWLGQGASSVAQGKTKKVAIAKLFAMYHMGLSYNEECVLSYQRFVPLRIGPWTKGGKWFAVFGIHFNFRYGKGMKGGWYIPFTKQNISSHSDWSIYRRFKKQQHS